MRPRFTTLTTCAASALLASLAAACFTSSSSGSGQTSFDAGFDGGFAEPDANGDSAMTPDVTVPPDASSPEVAPPAPEAAVEATIEATVDACPEASVDAATPSEAGLAGPVVGGTSLTWPEGLVVVGSTLYWFDSSDPYANSVGTMQKCDLSQGVCTPTLLPGMTGVPPNPQLYSDGTSFFMPLGAPAHANMHLMTCPVATCSNGNITSVSGVGFWDDITGAAADANNVYYAAGVLGSTYGIWIASKTGAFSPYSMVTGLPKTSNVAVDSSFVYFGEPGGGIYTCPLASDAAAICTPTLLQSTTATSGLVVDATDLYWGDPVAGAVYRCPIAGCGATSPTPIVTGQGHVNSLALAGAYILYSVGISVDAGLPNGVFGALR